MIQTNYGEVLFVYVEILRTRTVRWKSCWRWSNDADDESDTSSTPEDQQWLEASLMSLRDAEKRSHVLTVQLAALNDA